MQQGVVSIPTELTTIFPTFLIALQSGVQELPSKFVSGVVLVLWNNPIACKYFIVAPTFLELR